MDLKKIIEEKNTRLCFSADFTYSNELIKWINIVGPHICILKTHIDILQDFDFSLLVKLKNLKKKYNFLILEDRKFGDIGKTFEQQLFGGIYKIGTWADIITIHGICSDGMLNILNSYEKKPKILLVAQMSSKNNLITNSYTNNCYNKALKYSNLVLGFICQEKFVNNNNFLYLTPGIRLESKIEKDQVYKTPEEAFKKGSDVIIVGSGIYLHEKPLEIISLLK